nr:ricin B lectin-like protein [Nosema bombycis]
MWKLIWYILFIRAEEDELEDFINTPIKIFFAAYGSTFLGIDTKTRNLVARNKYIDFGKHNFDPVGKLVKNGDTYEIYYGGSRVCKTGSIISQCESDGGWKLSRANFGYTISKNSSCITKDKVDTVKMKKCTETEDQIFMFKSVSSSADCAVKEAMDTEDKHKINVNIIPVTSSKNDHVKIKKIRDIKSGNEDDKKTDDVRIFENQTVYTSSDKFKVTDFDSV